MNEIDRVRKMIVNGIGNKIKHVMLTDLERHTLLLIMVAGKPVTVASLSELFEVTPETAGSRIAQIEAKGYLKVLKDNGVKQYTIRNELL